MFARLRQTNANLRYLLADGLSLGLTEGILTYLPVFMVRLGASSLMLSVLTSLPAVVGMVLAIPIGEWLTRRANLVPWLARARLAFQLVFPLIGLTPFFFRGAEPPVIVALWAVAALPAAVVPIAITAVMGSAVPPEQRSLMTSWRWSLVSLTTSLSIVLVGVALERTQASYPLNYQAAFGVTLVGALGSFYFTNRIRLTERLNATPAALGQQLRLRGAAMRANRPFLNMLIAQVVFRAGMAMAVPLFPIFWVQRVHASDGDIGLINGVYTFTTIGAYFVWAHLARRLPAAWLLAAASLGIGLHPLLSTLFPAVPALVALAVWAGVMQAGVDVTFFDMLFKFFAPEEQAVYVATYQLIVQIAAFVAPVAGSLVLEALGPEAALNASTALRLAGVALLVALRVGQAPRGAAAPLPAE